jgi:stearoyl-CoA desaturase (delta-9 desaturase)
LFLIFVYAIPACLCLHSTSAIIVIAHIHGYKSHPLKNDQSRNSWIANLITLGEGWHNNHHAKPYAWSNWERWWEFDIPSLVIRVIKK